MCGRVFPILPYQDTMEVDGGDDVTNGLDALYELTEVHHHVLPLDDLGIAGKGWGQQSLVDQGFESHHDRVVWNRPYGGGGARV